MNVDLNGPMEWASFINQVLDRAFGEERYPVSVVDLAQTLTPRFSPDDPITVVEGAAMDGLDGVLVPDPQGMKGWGIFFNSSVPSRRRIRFTLGHELGHYLMHRKQYPKGFRCGNREVPTASGSTRIEDEADAFSANILMPMEDFCRQIAPEEWTDLNMLSCAADRYGVSLLAAIRQWLRYTRQRSVLVVSREGFVLWSEASVTARESGTCFPNVHKKPMEIPATSLAARREATGYPKDGFLLSKGSWFPEHDVVEMAVHSDQYDFVISLLMLDFERLEVVS